MTRLRFSLAVLVATAGLAFADPPTLTLPPKVEGGSFAVIAAVTDGKAVEYVPLDKGLEFFPATLLRDPKVAVVFGPKGAYRVLAYTGNADGPSKPVYTTVVLGGATVPIDPPKDPPKDPPVTGGKLYFVVVRANGPATPAFTKVMSDPAWGEIRAKGHLVKDFTTDEAAKLNLPVPTVSVPHVVTLRMSEDGSSSVVARPAVFLPTTGADILKLMEGVP